MCVCVIRRLKAKSAECVLLTVRAIVNCCEVGRRVIGKIPHVEVVIPEGSKSCMKTLTDFLPSVGGDGL
jgi:hypothetical protein